MVAVEMKQNEITSFIVNNKVWRVIGTEHGLKRLERRRLDKYQIASACLALGMKLEYYNNSQKQIMITDDGKNLSTLIAVENFTIVIITVLDKSNPYVKENTVVESFSFKLA